MKSALSILSILLIYAVVHISPAYAAGEENQQVIVKRSLNDFLQSEFDAELFVRTDPKMVIQDQAEREAAVEDDIITSPTLPYSSLIIVSAYSIAEVRMCGEYAFAKVTFRRVGRTKYYKGLDRRIEKDMRPNDSAEYILRFTEGAWRLHRPPLPRVSKKALTAYYAHSEENRNRILSSGEASKPQADNLKKDQRTLEALRQLPE